MKRDFLITASLYHYNHSQFVLGCNELLISYCYESARFLGVVFTMLLESGDGI